MGQNKSKGAPAPKQSTWSHRYYLAKFLVKTAIVLTAVNFGVQLYRKPTEILSLLSFGMRKSPERTWLAYQDYFRSSATSVLPAEFLAALAHLESNGNPWASPPWRLHATTKPFEFYAPATTAVGLYQFLDETYRQASQKGADSGPFMTRLSAQSSTQIAASYLNAELGRLIGNRPLPIEKQQTLAAIIHLCGKGKADQFLRSGFSWSRIGACGAHDPHRYVQQLFALKRNFAAIRDRVPTSSRNSWAYTR